MPNEVSPPPTKPPRAPAGARAPEWKVELVRSVRAVALKLIGTGNAGLLAVVLIVLALAWRLKSRELLTLLTLFATSQLVGVLGWLFFVLTLYFAHIYIRAANRAKLAEIEATIAAHEAELSRLFVTHREEVERLMIAGLVEPSAHSMLQSPPTRPPEPKEDYPPP